MRGALRRGNPAPPHAPSRSPNRPGNGKPTEITSNPKQPAVYIATNQRNFTLYVGVTSDLVRRISQHRTNAIPGFATRYGCKALVYFELQADMPTAIARENQLKAGSRAKKLALIEKNNPAWNDLYETIL